MVLYVYPYPVAVALSLLGMIIGSTVDFWLARRLGHDVVIKMLGRKLYEEIEHLINVEDSKTFLFVRLLGNNYFDPISYLAGLSKMPYGRFIVITSVTSAIWLSVILFVINKFSGLNQASSLFSVMGIYGGVILTGMIIWKFFHSRHFSLPTRPKGERR